MLQKTAHILATVLWLFLALSLAIIWSVKIRLGINGILLPYLILSLSPYVFNRTPTLFRRIHHCLVFPTLFISLGLSYYFIFHGGEQGGVGAYLVTYGVIAGYYIFICLFLLALAIRQFRSKS